MKISAYIPCYNNQSSIGTSIASIRGQSIPVDELFVVDDGSTDGSAEEVAALGVRGILHPANRGRGATRARAMEEATHELVLCLDAGKTIEPDFLKEALPWFDDPNVAAVQGWVTQPSANGVVERWRARHLYKSQPSEVGHRAKFATGAALLRASAARAVGNFNVTLRHGEDADLGDRLLDAGYDVVFDPKLKIHSAAPNSLAKVLERYWRWNTAPHGPMGVKQYLKHILYSCKVMAREDLRARDPQAVFISLLTPHYQYWKSRFGKDFRD